MSPEGVACRKSRSFSTPDFLWATGVFFPFFFPYDGVHFSDGSSLAHQDLDTQITDSM
jgi:hypothetical protein